MKHTILCVDDEIDNVEALERIFRTKYKVLKATSGRQALSILDQHPEPIAVIITDQRMPEMTGVQFLEQSMRTHAESLRILLTGYTDLESVIAAINTGQIYRYLNKPWDPLDLMSTVERAVERYNLNQELKKKNLELSNALAELQTLDQAKNHFMVLINHELKTPLTSILSFSELLSETKLDEEQEVCLTRIQKSADRLKNLIEDVLLVVGGETQTLKLKILPFEGAQLQLRLTSDAQKMMSEKGQKVTHQWLEKKLVGDQPMLEQVISRLIHNAIKFGLEKSTIEVAATQTHPHRIRISVFNQGPSISPQMIDKILRPFYMDEDVMNHSTGMGLGLSVCHSILKAHATQLHLENRSGGVEASFELPCL